MFWKHGVIIVLALAAASCSKKPEESPAAEPEWPKHGLTEEVLASTDGVAGAVG